jgi:hypothetical protein
MNYNSYTAQVNCIKNKITLVVDFYYLPFKDIRSLRVSFMELKQIFKWRNEKMGKNPKKQL